MSLFNRRPAPQSAAPVTPKFGDTVKIETEFSTLFGEVVSCYAPTGRVQVYYFDPIYKGGSWQRNCFDLARVSVVIPGGALSVWTLFPQAVQP